MTDTTAPTQSQTGILGWIEKTGNKLPDPVFIFFYLMIGLVVVSVIAALVGLSATLNDDVMAGMSDASKARFSIGEDGVIPAISLLSAENISAYGSRCRKRSPTSIRSVMCWW